MVTACPTSDDERLYHMLKALGNPVRLEIMRFVLRRPRCIGNEILLHLPDGMARAQSTLSQHLKILCSAGLLEAECDGPATCYAVNEECMGWLREQLAELSHSIDNISAPLHSSLK